MLHTQFFTEQEKTDLIPGSMDVVDGVLQFVTLLDSEKSRRIRMLVKVRHHLADVL